MGRWLAALSLALLAACVRPPVDTGGGDDTGSSSDTDTDVAAPVSPCTAGGWGLLADPEDAVHVRATGLPTGTGSADDPVDSVAAALILTRSLGKHAIFVGPGTFATNVVVDVRDSGLRLLGCGAESVLSGGGARSTVAISAASDVVVDSVQIDGGRRALLVWAGATATVSHTGVSNATRNGVIVDGELTRLDLSDVFVASVTPEARDPAVGFGVVVQQATLHMTGGGIGSATGVGLFAEGGEVSLDGVTITATLSAPDGTLGRGVHVQELADVRIAGGAITANADAAVFALRAASLVVDGVEIDRTGAAATPDGAPTGDGIVVTAGDSSFDPGTFLAAITGNTITNSARAPILIIGSSVEATDLSSNTFTGNGYEPDGKGVIVQNSAVAPPETGYYDIDSEGVAPLDTNDGGLSAETPD